MSKYTERITNVAQEMYKMRCFACGNIMKQISDTLWHCPVCDPRKDE